MKNLAGSWQCDKPFTRQFRAHRSRLQKSCRLSVFVNTASAVQNGFWSFWVFKLIICLWRRRFVALRHNVSFRLYRKDFSTNTAVCLRQLERNVVGECKRWRQVLQRDRWGQGRFLLSLQGEAESGALGSQLQVPEVPSGQNFLHLDICRWHLTVMYRKICHRFFSSICQSWLPVSTLLS